MKNIRLLLLFGLFLLKATNSLQAQCNNYACKMELARKALKKGEYKSALDHARGAESYDASKKVLSSSRTTLPRKSRVILTKTYTFTTKF
jgi:hypothetical protein